MSTKKVILGIDEVGRGPWAGPLVVGAVILGDDFTKTNPAYQELADSKKLGKTKREKLNPLILEGSAASATGWVTAEELDRYGLSASLKLATRRAVKQVLAQKVYFSEIIIDGTSNFLVNTPLEHHVTVLKKADSLVKEVSAASIIAKVARDNYMTKLATKYPEYGFENHAGYGTTAHKTALEQSGVCPEHRQSFRPVREIYEKQKSGHYQVENRILNPAAKISPTLRGKTAETVVKDYLTIKGHQILHQNYKTKTCEIDIISTKDHEIFFTEVKYSSTLLHEGSPLARITTKKQSQMHFAAQTFLASHPEYKTFQPLLAVAAVSGPRFQINDWFVLA